LSRYGAALSVVKVSSGVEYKRPIMRAANFVKLLSDHAAEKVR
jgi:hypothetical protein